jgi:retron-type reverse transcriptase
MFDKIFSWGNIVLAHRLAAKGKRRHRSAAQFEYKLADQLLNLQHSLRMGTYRPGGYTHFYIHEPKRRKVSAAPFRDRVVHHAICNVIEPIYESHFIANSFANRKNKGTHRAIDQLQIYALRYPFVLRADIIQHFPSIDHLILQDFLTPYIQCPRTLHLIALILASGDGILSSEYTPVLFKGDDTSALNRPRGLPIGNLTSQFWSNVYMHELDKFVTRDLHCPGYVRYVDDFALFSDSKQALWEYRHAIIAKLASMRLTLHNNEADVFPVSNGIPWLGFVVYPSHRQIKRRNAVKFTRRLAHNLDLYQTGQISFAELDASVQGWINHVRFADTWGLRQHILDQAIITKPPQTPQKPALPQESKTEQYVKFFKKTSN